MEIPETLGGILEVCILDKASVIQRIASGVFMSSTWVAKPFSL